MYISEIRLSNTYILSITEPEYLFKKRNQLFPEELFILLCRLGYEHSYSFSVIQKEMDRAYHDWKKEAQKMQDRENPFLNPCMETII